MAKFSRAEVVELTNEENYVLEQVLYALKFFLPLSHPEWHDLSERTKRSPEETLAILHTIRTKLHKPE